MSLGWLLASCLLAGFMGRTLYAVATAATTPGSDDFAADPRSVWSEAIP
jgi:hypothetical protein